METENQKKECCYRVSDFEDAQARMLLKGTRIVFDAFYYNTPTRFVRCATGTFRKDHGKTYRVAWDHLGQATIGLLIDRVPEFDLQMDPPADHMNH